MSNGQYRQQWQQGPVPSQQQYQYDRRDEQMYRQDPRPQPQDYNQDYQRYNQNPKSRNNGYDVRQGQAPTPVHYEQEQQWQSQDPYLQDGYQDSYARTGGAQWQEPSRNQQYQGNGADRTYQYDERYRNNGQGRPPLQQGPSSYSSGGGNPRGQRSDRSDRSEQSTPKKSRGRDRILAQPSSPKNLAWDNPFGAFPPKQKKTSETDKERHQSLDKAMDDLSISDRRYSGGLEARPHTSHGQRGGQRREPPRPGTSQDRHPNMGPPAFTPQHPNMPPGRQSPEVQRRQMNTQPQSPPRRPPPQAVPRGPLPLSSEDRPRPGPPGGMGNVDSHGNNGFQYSDPGQLRNRPDERGFDDGYHRDHIPQSRAYQSPIDPPHARDPLQRSATFEEFQHPPQSATIEHFGPPSRAATFQGYDQGGPPGGVSSNLSKTASHDMPNFDAIPSQPYEKPDELFGTSPASFGKPYQKPVYQIPGSFPTPIDTTQTNSGRGDTVNSPLADFSFDLPQNPNARSMRPSRNEAGTPSQPHRAYQYGDQRGFDPAAAPIGGYEDPRRQQNPSQFPPRAASRNGMKPDQSRPPPMPVSGQEGYRSFSDGQYPRGQMNGLQGPPGAVDMSNRYDKNFRPNGRDMHKPGSAPPSDPQNWNPSGPNQPYQQQQHYDRGVPGRTTSQDNYDSSMPGPPGPPRQPFVRNAHPVPVRNYGTPPPAPVPTPAPIPRNNPDALPAHPEPMRPNANNFNNGFTAANVQQQRQQQQTPVPQNGARQVSGSGANSGSAAKEAPVTLQEINGMRSQYSRSPSDQALGLRLAKKLVEAARVLSDDGGRADAKQTQKNRENYIFEAHKLTKKLVSANYPEAMFYLADCHGQGLLGLAVDPKEAFNLYQSAAKLNHAPSAYRVAVCCELGQEEGGGTRRDPLKAIQWYKRAATLGDTPAMYKMGIILLKGLLGQQRNPREAVSWLKRAAERADKDNPHAVHELGLLYESAAPSDHIIKDERYAVQLFTQAAELGYKYSQFRLGSAYEYGLLGLPIDARQSIAWYTRAAAQGEHQSELALSGWYLTGSEPLLMQSDTEAFLWARKAASSGLAKAEYAMGYFFEVGIGTAVDVEEAKRWYYRAAAQNIPKARERLEELKRGGQRQTKSRVSRSQVNRQSDGECSVM